jgi:hypothetical protein
MNIFRYLYLLLVLPATCLAQDKPIGYWRAHLPYSTALGVASDGNMLYTVCNEGFFTYDNSKGQLEPYSKVEGMSDLGMACIAYDHATKTAVLAYQDGNIDLFKDNTFYNIPDLKIKSVSGTKQIHHIYIEAGMAYLSTDIGILVVDLTNRVIQETYVFTISNQTIPIKDYSADNTYFYAATPAGLFRAPKSKYAQLQNFSVWANLDNTHSYVSLAALNGKIYAADTSKIFVLSQSTLSQIYTSKLIINHLDAGINTLLVSEYLPSKFKGDIKIIDSASHSIDSFSISGQPVQALQLLNGTYWVADAFRGLQQRTDTNNVNAHYPNGPGDHNNFDIYAYNKNVWVAHGGYNDHFVSNNSGSGMSNFSNNGWATYQDFVYAPFFDTVRDIVAITKDRADGTVYAGSFSGGGLFELKSDNTYQILKQHSIFDLSYNNVAYQIMGLGFDHVNNLWMTMLGSPHELLVKTAAGNWYKFNVNNVLRSDVSRPMNYQNAVGPLIVDNNDQIWYWGILGGGVIVYNPNGTPDNPADDVASVITEGAGSGNLPSNNVGSIVQDNNGDMWIGTDKGIAIISCAANYTTAPCDATIPIVQYDQYANYLFVDEYVHAMAVDGGNRKWVGTDNGIWLLSPDASKIIFHFTVDNSPLPSNHVQKITIDAVTGDVYIGTDFGLVSYHGNAIEGGTTNSHVVSYPDPVPSGYSGTIAIKGLVANADVRITDITGQLVYRTTALGGQAVWNGMDYTGHRPQSGVYLIFVTNSDGTQTFAGKMVFIK